MKRRVIALVCLTAMLLPVMSTAACAEETAVVSFEITPNDADIIVSQGIGYTYTELTMEGVEAACAEESTARWEYALEQGNYTATITNDGCYASVFSFTVTDTGKVTAVDNKGNVKDYLKDGVFTVALGEFAPSETEGAWDGRTLDVSWYDENAQTMTIYTPEQFSGMAAIVNGICNAEITTILDDADGDGLSEAYTPEEYAVLEKRKIRPANSEAGTGSNNLVTTNSYWYGVKSDGKTPSDFNGQTVLLACDLDMGGWQKDGVWTGARYMSIGGQSLMHYLDYSAWKSDGFSHLGSSFNGTLDGQGHYVRNVYCDRYGAGTNYGDSSAVGLIGRLGCHDNDPLELMAVDPTVKNIAVTGYIYGRRSVGGIVGKIGRTTADRLGDGSTGGIIESCLNFAEVRNTDAKGCGGIVGAGWNEGIVRYCANFGNVHSSYSCPTGGISGSNEVMLESCHNVGMISASAPSYAMAIGTNNGGASSIDRCFWLTGTATGGGYYNGKGAVEITDNYEGFGLSAQDYMKSEAFLAALNGSSRAWTQEEAGGYPVPRAFTVDTATVTAVEKVSDPVTLEYVAGQHFDPTGLEIYAAYSDGTRELVENYCITPDRALQIGDTAVVISGTFANHSYRYEYPITVVEAEPVDLIIAKAPQNLLYASDETFSTDGMVVQAFYSNAPQTGITLAAEDYGWALNGSLLTVSYTFGGKTLSASCELTWLDTPKPVKDHSGFYQLSTQNDLRWFANQVNALGLCSAKAVLTENITVTASEFDGIGAIGNAYIGKFDGNGRTVTLHMQSDGAVGLFAVVGAASISNVTVEGSISTTSTTAGAAGLVGYVAALEEGAVLSVENCTNRAEVTAPAYAGGIVGKSMTSAVCVFNCRNEGTLSVSGNYAGGIVGYTAGGSRITNCVNVGTVNARSNCGGIVGSLRAGSDQSAAFITDCVNIGTLTASDNVGGIVGYMAGSSEEKSITVARCENRGAVTGTNAVGGIVGYAFYKADKVEQCCNTGAISGTASKAVGGIVGYNRASIFDVYNLGAISASDGVVGGIVGTAAQVDSEIKNAYHAGTLEAASKGTILGYAASDVTVTNCHDLTGSTCGELADGKTVNGAAVAHTPQELMMLAADLGEALKISDICPQAYPVLTWQTGTPHSFNEGTVTIVPTCTKQGEMTFTCGVCGMIQTAELAASTCPSEQFEDIPANSWYHDAVDFMVTQGSMNGVGDHSFAPDGTLTRAQLVTVLYRLAGAPTVDRENNPFTDVANNTWYTDAVIWGVQNGVVYGTGDSEFTPDGEITREQIAAMLYRYVQADAAAKDHLSDFLDGAQTSAYAKEAMNWAIENGLISGSSEDGKIYLLPQNHATRAQIALILMRWLQQ